MVPRTCKVSFGVEPSASPEEAIYSTPLMLRWIARCTSVSIRSGSAARSKAAVAFIVVLLVIDDWQLLAAAFGRFPQPQSIRFRCRAAPAATWPWQEPATTRTRRNGPEYRAACQGRARH